MPKHRLLRLLIFTVAQTDISTLLFYHYSQNSVSEKMRFI